MPRLGSWVEFGTKTGKTQHVDDITVTPVAWSLSLRLPRTHVVYNRPVAVLVDREGRVERVTITDVTRLVQTALVGCMLLLVWRRKRRG